MFSRCFVLLSAVALLCFANANYKEEFGGKVVLVTGGSSGIGYQTALQFAQYGAKVIIVARDSHPNWFNGDTAAKNINDDETVKQSGGSCRFFKADMSNATEVKALFKNIRENENDLHFAVNSAGITGPLGVLSSNRRYMGTVNDPMRNNLYAGIYSCMYEARLMTEKNHSSAIVNLASTNGLTATPRGSMYGTSKFGVVGLTRSVADTFSKLGNNIIRVNAIAPTLTDTSLTWNQAKYLFDKTTQPWEEPYITPDSLLWQVVGPTWVNRLTAKAIATPKMMADAILFLCSSDSSFVTGSILSVDRGQTA